MNEPKKGDKVDVFIIKPRYFTKCEQFYWIPTFTYTGAGYPKPKKGIIVTWLGWCKRLRKPINERR